MMSNLEEQTFFNINSLIFVSKSSYRYLFVNERNWYGKIIVFLEVSCECSYLLARTSSLFISKIIIELLIFDIGAKLQKIKRVIGKIILFNEIWVFFFNKNIPLNNSNGNTKNTKKNEIILEFIVLFSFW